MERQSDRADPSSSLLRTERVTMEQNPVRYQVPLAYPQRKLPIPYRVLAALPSVSSTFALMTNGLRKEMRLGYDKTWNGTAARALGIPEREKEEALAMDQSYGASSLYPMIPLD